jgi:hypothetical protein
VQQLSQLRIGHGVLHWRKWFVGMRSFLHTKPGTALRPSRGGEHVWGRRSVLFAQYR